MIVLTVLFAGWALVCLWWMVADLLALWDCRHDPFPFEDLRLCLCGRQVLPRGGLPVVDRDVWHEADRCQPVPEVLWS